MTTITMQGGASLFAGHSLAERQGPALDHSDESGLRELRHLAAVQIERSKVGGESKQGRPPVISANLIIAMQWVMFAACALRVAMLAQ
jgi:hypothetical protein